MKRTFVTRALAIPVVAFLAANAFAAENSQQNGPPPCTDPIPSAKQARLLKRFGEKGIDANRDGTLTCSEVNAFFQANPQLKPHHARAEECTDPIPAGKQAKLLKQFGDKGIDANKDNALICAEVNAFFQSNPQLKSRHEKFEDCTDPMPANKQAKMMKRFGSKGIDANKDGVLTCDEVKAFYATRSAERQAKTNQQPPQPK